MHGDEGPVQPMLNKENIKKPTNVLPYAAEGQKSKMGLIGLKSSCQQGGISF